jgi:SPOR domain
MAGAAHARQHLGAGGGAGRTHVRRRERCPECGAPSQRRQLVCLGCGERLALVPKQAQGLRPGVAAAAILMLVGGLAGVFVGQALLLGDSNEAEPTLATATAPTRARADTPRRATGKPAVERSPTAAEWPASRAAWTVQLFGGDRDGARRFAAELERSGVEAAAISPEQRPDLGSLWTVVSGVHGDEAAAVAAANELRQRYPGAFSRYVPQAPTTGAAAQPPPG